MNQLKLTKEELIKIGFEECFSIGDKLNESKQFFKIKTINGYFYFNPRENKFTWYHKTILGSLSNDVNLNINSKPELFILLSIFNVNFTLVT